MKNFLIGLLTLVLLGLTIALLIVGHEALFSTAPLFVLLLEGIAVYCIVAGVIGLTIHLIHRERLYAERYRFETYRLEPIGANYPAVYNQGTIIQASPGILPQPVPHTVNYAPKITYPSPVPALDSIQGAIPPLPPLLPKPLPFSTIIENVSMRSLCLGCGVEGAIYGSIDDLLSTAIVGRPGTGKTTLLRFVLAQVLKVGGMPVLLDPHGNIADELGDVLSCSETPREIEATARWLEQELDKRLVLRRQGQAMGNPILLLADEWPIIAASSSIAVNVMQRIVLEGRKVGMYALISGQGLPAAILNGTLVRDALSSRYVFHTTPQQARLAGLDNDTAKELLSALDTAGAGKAILASARLKPEIVAIPDTTTADIRSCIVDSSVNVPSGSLARPPALQAVPRVSEQKTFYPQNISSQEREQIINLAKQGVKRRDMCEKLGKGKAYYPVIKTVLDEYEQQQIAS